MKKLKLHCTLAITLLFISWNVQGQDFIEDLYIEGGTSSYKTTDFNDDGLLDLIGYNYKFLGPIDLEILLNESDTALKFEPIVLASSVFFNGTPAVGDLDGDGDIDIAVSIDINRDIFILRNDGDNSFTQEPTGFSGVNELTFNDLDGDGDTDLIGYVFNDNIVATFLNDGTGTLTEGTFTEHVNDISSIDYGDIDDDGDVDFALSVNKFSGETVAIYLNDSLNNFTKLSSFDINALNSALQVKLVDINRDGKMDVLGLNDKKLTAFLQTEVFGFIDQDLISPNNSEDLSTFEVADFDGNGTNDIIIGDLAADLHWYKNTGLIFTQMLVSDVNPVFGMVTEDFDLDGDVDVVVTNGNVWAYRNKIEQMPSSVSLISPSKIELYPNPANEYFKLTSPRDGQYIMRLIDVNGQLLDSQSFTKSIDVSLDGFASGIYHIQVFNLENNTFTIEKLTKN